MRHCFIRALLAILPLILSVSDGWSEMILTGRNITTRDGLPSNLVHDMLQDADGYIWLGTPNGLCRYDGYSFLPINIKSNHGQTNDGIGTLYYDERNKLIWTRSATFFFSCYDLNKGCFVDYIGNCDRQKTFQKYIAEENGIWMYESYAVRHVTYHDGRFVCTDYSRKDICSNGRKISRLVADGIGGVWILTNNGLLHIEANGTIKTVIKEGYMKMGHRWKNHCLILTSGNRVFVFDQQGKMVKETAIPAVFGEEEMVNGNIIWQGKWVIISRTKVITMDCRNYTFEKSQDMQMDYGIPLNDINGSHWISDKDGILHLFPREGKVQSFRLLKDTGYSIVKRRRFSVAEGTDGKSYIATFGNGLFVYNPDDGHLDHYTANDKQAVLSSDYLIDIMADRQGNIWISQEETGIVCLSQKWLASSRHFYPDLHQMGGMTNYVKDLAESKDGTVLVSTRSQQQFRLDPQTGILTKAGTISFDDTNIVSLTDKLGRAWVGTWEEGLLLKYKDGDKSKQKVFLTRSTTESRINALVLDKTDRLWIATYHGIFTVDAKKTDIKEEDFQHYGTQEGLPSNHVSCLAIDDSNRLWIGTQGHGIARCTFKDNGEMDIQQYTTKRGLVSNNIHSIVADNDGQIWAGTDDAMTRINPKTTDIGIYQFNTSMLNNLYSDRCALRLKDGRLLFGTHHGLTMITPSQTNEPNEKNLRAQITNIDINGTSIFDSDRDAPFLLIREGLVLANDENSLTFYFSCFDFAHSGHVSYQFWLEGVDKDWREPTTQNNVDYDKLPPGDYTFHLRTSNDEETTLSITILQPWYNTWWAWLLYLLIMGTAAWYVYRNWKERFRMHQQMKIEKEMSEFRANFFTQVAHEFRTPLAIISGAVDKLGDDGSAQRKTIQTVRRGVRRLTQLVNQLMEFRKIRTNNLRMHVEKGDIVGFVRDICQDFWNAAQQKDQSLAFTPFAKKYETVFDHHIIDTITYNLISNAIKYTPQKGTISVRLRKEEDCLVLSVEDSGPGIDKAREQQLFQPFMHGYASQGGMGIGLYTAYQMAQIHRGRLAYSRSETLGGSMLMLTIPADDHLYEAEDYKSVNAIDKKDDHQSQAEIVIKEMQPQPLNDRLVIVIEDDPDMLEQIKTEVGVYFHVEGYTDGKSGLEALKAQKPSLLICDIMLPDMSGYDIVNHVKTDHALKHLPVLMLTALDDERHQIKGYEVGADDYMVKPCNYSLLMARAFQLVRWNEDKRNQSMQEEKSQSDDSESVSTILTSVADKRFLEKVNAIMAQHISDSDFSIDQMAETMKMGRTKFYGKVKELTGMSPNKLLISERMRIAAELLEEGELNISEIGYRVGLSDASYFNKCFKQHFGVAPSKYKKGI